MICGAGNFQTRTWENRSISPSRAFETADGIAIAIVQRAATLHLGRKRPMGSSSQMGYIDM